MSDVAADPTLAPDLRDTLTNRLIAEGTIRSATVEAAFRRVPRHLFTPGEDLARAYAPDVALVKKKDEHGVTVSSVSAARIQAMMLEQADLGSGMRVLEIGSGGLNAALIAEIVGEGGHVTTVDIDPDVVERARSCLAVAGYQRVDVVLADGEQGWAANAPYDRIVVTVGAWDIPPAWANQLADEGALVVPLRIRGLTRSVTFARSGHHLLSRSAQICGFVPMRGDGAHEERLVPLRGGEVVLRFDEAQRIDPDGLDRVFDTARYEAWSQVGVGRLEPFDTLQVWLATAMDGFCLLGVDPAADRDLISPQNRLACPAAVSDATLAYLALRRTDEDRFEFGVHGFGAHAAALAEQMAAQVRVWDRAHRAGPGPQIAAYPAGTNTERLPGGLVIDKRHVRITVSWPTTVSGVDQGVVQHPTKEE